MSDSFVFFYVFEVLVFKVFLWGLEESGQLKTINLTTLFDSLASALSTELHMHKCLTKNRLLTYIVKSLQQWLKLLLALSGSVLKVQDFVQQQLMFHKPVSIVTGGNFLIGWVQRCVPQRHLWHFIYNWGWWRGRRRRWCFLVKSHLWSYMRALHILQSTKTFNNSRSHSSESDLSWAVWYYQTEFLVFYEKTIQQDFRTRSDRYSLSVHWYYSHSKRQWNNVPIPNQVL